MLTDAQKRLLHDLGLVIEWGPRIAMLAGPGLPRPVPLVRVGDWWNPVDDLEGAASSLWDLASSAATSIGQVASAIGGAFADAGAAVWAVASACATWTVNLPGIHLLVQVFDDATHLLDVILDSPITALCVVALAAVLNVVGLGSPLLAEYAALRLGMDLLVKLEDGDRFTVLDLAKTVVLAASTATGLPLGAALPAEAVIQKAASGQTITEGDIQSLTLATASVAAGASGDPSAMATVSGVAAASNVVASGIKAQEALDQMPATVDPNSATRLPPQVVRHLMTRAPTVAQHASQTGAFVTAMQDAQSALVAAARFATTDHADYAGRDPNVDPLGAFIDCLQIDSEGQTKFGLAVTPSEAARLSYIEANADVPIFPAPGPNSSAAEWLYAYQQILFAVARWRVEKLPVGQALDHLTLARIHYFQDRLKIPEFDPPDPRTVPPSAPASSPTANAGAPLPPRGKSPYPPIGFPEAPPPYNPPAWTGPTYPARDVGRG